MESRISGVCNQFYFGGGGLNGLSVLPSLYKSIALPWVYVLHIYDAMAALAASCKL